jgi:HD-GYP domain-containing protein (c-di-GMP phosphodiesterase class II)
MPHRSRISAALLPAAVPVPSESLATVLAGLSRHRDRGELRTAICEAAGTMLALDAVALVRLTPDGIACEARWARPGARPNRVGEARMAMAAELCEDSGGEIVQRTFGRLQLVSIPITSGGAVSHVLAATARPTRLLSDGDRSLAVSLATHDGTCIEMAAAVSAAREYVMLEQAMKPVEMTRGDRALEQMLLGIADQALLAITNRALYDELDGSFLATVQALGNALDLKDSYTNEHAQALVGLCTEVAERLGLTGGALRDISFAAALHDIGKIGIPAEILNKPGPLTAEEFAVMRTHPRLGAQILKPVAALAGAAELVLACHEHWDGSGYPLGLAGDQIPLGARVILACDAFDAMTTDRVYRKAMTGPDAMAELRRCSGTHFDPRVVDVLVAVVAAGVERDQPPV